ncbi:hypothetical protein HGRIS_003885 [Hohenbuehelia grisea]|uniref:DNA2/NAM7 helicase-like C-terminal domain-containing protein n=1 Tax=Hohenbuehelia grisea TaxID=104357 RepID=A0ABR3JHF5_9AGAR
MVAAPLSSSLRPVVFTSLPSDVSIDVSSTVDRKLTKELIGGFLGDVVDGVLGMAAISLVKGTALAFSTSSRVLIIEFPGNQKQTKKRVDGTMVLASTILLNAAYKKFAFRMDRAVPLIHLDIGLDICNAIDMLSVSPSRRNSLEAFFDALGGSAMLNRDAAVELFEHVHARFTRLNELALMAWCAHHAATLEHMLTRFAGVLPVNTPLVNRQQLMVICQTMRDADQLHTLKPWEIKNEIRDQFTHKDGKLQVSSERYNTRLMSTSGHQILHIEAEHNGQTKKLQGRAKRVVGRDANILIENALSGNIESIKSVTTIGREPPANAEVQRMQLMLRTLQRPGTLMRGKFVQHIWFSSPSAASTVAPPSSIEASFDVILPSLQLNASQHAAVEEILDVNKPITLIHGPPGTGKTTVIAAAVIRKMQSQNPSGSIWLCAQSNVAVKNIAEKLAALDFLDFKLLVSKDFHFDWHEHLYEKIDQNVIRSDSFKDSTVAMSRKLCGARVILCTLAMFSNPRFSAVTSVVPVETSKLRKLVFIGDDKQLPPHGQEDLGNLRSIFELDHLKDDAIFLDTQYRMPIPLGNFISEHVYDGKLKSEHSMTGLSCCSFVDVKRGKEQKKGKSWMNMEEARTVINLAEKVHSEGHRWRIITPYDSQRSFIESRLKAEGKVPWEDKCFNVDSFQGNEDDIIIVSVVPTDRIGFLQELRRVNVMLTRCTQRMIVCTNRSFIEDIAGSTLLGMMAAAFGDGVWV